MDYADIKDDLTQKAAVLTYLIENRSEDYIPAHKFTGVKTFESLDNLEFLMSYECPHRLTDIFQDNPKLLERKKIEGRTGAKYFGYRINPDVIDYREVIEDPNLKVFYIKYLE